MERQGKRWRSPGEGDLGITKRIEGLRNSQRGSQQWKSWGALLKVIKSAGICSVAEGRWQE